jgi:phosphate-selective porin
MERAMNGDTAGDETTGDTKIGGAYTQIGMEAIYRFGTDERVNLAGRFNSVSGKGNDESGTLNKKTSRINIGGGWFMTDNVLTKIEYVKQSYTDDGWNGSKYQGSIFNGIVIEAAISF